MSDQPPPAVPPSSSSNEPEPTAGPVVPAPGGVPAGAYPWGGAPGWYHQPGYAFDPSDALVTPPGAGLGAWVARCVDAIGRGWRLLLPILVLTQVLPAVALSVLVLAVDPSARWEAEIAGDSDLVPATFWADILSLVGVTVGASLVFGLVQCVGWAAGTWVIARQAAGEPVSLGASLRYGLRRALGLWGWTLILALIFAIGFCLCILPGIYAVFALAMAGPVYLFERRDPIGRSHRMLRERLGLLLSRLAVVIAVVVGVSIATAVVESVAIEPFGLTPLDSAGTAVGVVLAITLAALLALPAHFFQLVGLVVTYAEQRAHEGPVNGAQLATELG